MLETGELKAFPAYRQAMREFLAEFSYGDLVTHAWLEEHFGMLTIDDSQRLTAEAFRERQFAWLASIEAFKNELLRDHQVHLQSVRGEGYRWVPPAEQTGIATKEFERDAKRAFRSAGSRLRNVRVGELNDEQRRENVDALAKISTLKGMTRKALE
jgi:hypothetical protein